MVEMEVEMRLAKLSRIWMTTWLPIESQVIKPRGLIEFHTKLVQRRGLVRRRRRRRATTLLHT
jgi:hypothetical protein